MEKDMSKGNPLWLLTAFAFPLFLGNLFQQFYQVVDTIIVGRFVGVEALAAVGCTGGFSFIVIGFSQGLGAGFSVLICQSFGAKDYKRMQKAYAMAILCSVLSSAVISILFFSLSKPLLLAVNTPANIIDMANTYISVIYIGIIACIFYNLFSAILRAVGDGKSPLIFLIISSVLNIAFDLLFVLVFPWGCFGVAFATILSQGISAVLSYIYIMKNFAFFRFEKGDFAIDRNICRKLWRLGLPGALQFSVCAIGVIIVQISINSFGSDYVAGYAIGTKIEGLITQAFPAIGMAISTYAGQNLGAGNIARIRKGFKAGLLMCIITTIISQSCALVLATPLTNLFISGTISPAVINSSVLYLRIVSYFFLPLSLIFLFRTGCQGLGSGFIPMASSVIELALRVLTAFLFPYFWGFTGLCFASPAAWVGAGFILPVFYHHQMKVIIRKLRIPTYPGEEKSAKIDI